MSPYRFLTGVAIVVTLRLPPALQDSREHDVPCGYGDRACICREDADVCKFFLALEQYKTFTRYEPTQPYGRQGRGRLYHIENSTGELLPLSSGSGAADV